ncbi:MAG: DUF3798 domain-containing protein, partial [Treponema sp.]|nr:DUF3798 domain-containing protein [Treponema sp.]
MKKRVFSLAAAVAAVVLSFSFASCAGDGAEEGWKIGIITGTVSQGEEEYLAARMMEERFGADRIIRTTYPDNFSAEMEVTIANTLAL